MHGDILDPARLSEADRVLYRDVEATGWVGSEDSLELVRQFRIALAAMRERRGFDDDQCREEFGGAAQEWAATHALDGWPSKHHFRRMMVAIAEQLIGQAAT